MQKTEPIQITAIRKVGNPSPCVPIATTQLASDAKHAEEIVTYLLRNPTVQAITIVNL